MDGDYAYALQLQELEYQGAKQKVKPEPPKK